MNARYGALAAIITLATLGGAQAQDKPQTKQTPLPIGQVALGATGAEVGAAYTFVADAAGILTVVLRGENDTDFVLMVTDEDGQPLPDGRSDHDIGGDHGAEQVAVTIPYPGTFVAHVDVNGGAAGKFHLGASWLPMPQVAREPDPDGSPRLATALEIGKPKNDSVDGSTGDLWDWFSVQATEAGTLTVLTKCDGEGDLVLESFTAGSFVRAADRSDQDMQGVKGNESVTAHVNAGETIYFRVSSLFGGGAISYRITSGMIPD